MQLILPFIAGIISFMAFDYLWLAHIAKNFYLSRLASHVKIENGALVPYLPAVPLVYVVAVLSISFFVLNQAKDSVSALMYGALLGFFMYAFYDLTNMATLKDYSWPLTIVDSLWGACIVAIVSLIMWNVKAHL